MFADPQTVTISGSSIPLPRIPSSAPTRQGLFQSADGNTQLLISQNSTANRFRREFRLTSKKVAADPISAVNKEVSASVVMVIDEPRWGFTDADLAALCTGLIAAFTAGTRDKVLGGEL